MTLTAKFATASTPDCCGYQIVMVIVFWGRFVVMEFKTLSLIIFLALCHVSKSSTYFSYHAFIWIMQFFTSLNGWLHSLKVQWQQNLIIYEQKHGCAVNEKKISHFYVHSQEVACCSISNNTLVWYIKNLNSLNTATTDISKEPMYVGIYAIYRYMHTHIHTHTYHTYFGCCLAIKPLNLNSMW